MTTTYRQSISDELAAALDAKRGLLSRQEYTTLALVAALEQPTVAELQRQVAELRAELQGARVAPAPPPTAPVACAAVEMLSF